jgi:CBS domain-containing protein
MQLREIMTTDVEVISPDIPLQQAAQRMREIDTGFLPVGENDRLVGTLTDRDIAVRAVADGRDPKATRVRETMSEKVVYCFEDQDTKEAAQIMGEHQIRRLPVLSRDKRLVGVVSLGDIASEARETRTVGAATQQVSHKTGQSRRM